VRIKRIKLTIERKEVMWILLPGQLLAMTLFLCILLPASTQTREKDESVPLYQGLSGEEKQYLERSALIPGTVVLPSGLQYRVISSGSTDWELVIKIQTLKTSYVPHQLVCPGVPF
jgi:hypothetical protein